MNGLGMAERDAIIAALDAIDGSDPERAHGLADDLICEALPEEVRQAYSRVERRCSWWASA